MIDVRLGVVDGVIDIDMSIDGLDEVKSLVLVSLFCDGEPDGEDIEEFGKKGFWGNMFLTEGEKIGSRLWTLRRRKLNQATLDLYEIYSKEALRWLIDKGYANRIEVMALKKEGGIILDVKVDGVSVRVDI